MGGTRVWGPGGLLLLALGLGSACARPPGDEHARLEALQRDSRQLDEALHGVESRLLANQASVHLWQELRRRHGQVSQLHCENANQHLEAIALHHQRQEEKARALQRRRQVASVVDSTVMTGGKVRGRSRN